MLNIPITAGTGKAVSSAFPAVGNFLGNIFGGVLGFKGQDKANKQNLAIAREQMAFQERMSNTAYQRSARDIEKAGLNRILALGNPASSPQGQSAQMESALGAASPHVSKAVGSALAAKQLVYQLENIKEQNRLIKAQAGNAAAQAGATDTRRQLDQELLNLYKQYPALRMIQALTGAGGVASGTALGAAGLFLKGKGKK